VTKNEYAKQIAELICKRYFRAKGFNDLPFQFWNDRRFARDYRLQIIQAYALLKMYEGQAILNALNSKEGLNTYSLRARWLDPLFERESAKLKKVEEKMMEYVEKVEENAVELPTARPSFQPKQSTLDKLD
jgi:hypothetical protein